MGNVHPCAFCEQPISASSRWRFCDAECAFWFRVEIGRPEDCWLWTGTRDADGYGHFPINRRTVRASRYSLSRVIGRIPRGQLACHHCDNPPCVNPAHLFAGSVKDNADDMVRKGRGKWFALPSPPRGEANMNARNTEADIMAIRAEYAAGRTMYSIAKERGMCRDTVRQIVQRRTWRHVA